MSAGCTTLQQRNNNEPATIQPAAEAELTLGAERTKNKLADTCGTDILAVKARLSLPFRGVLGTIIDEFWIVEL
jgi:hypothetical protein